MHFLFVARPPGKLWNAGRAFSIVSVRFYVLWKKSCKYVCKVQVLYECVIRYSCLLGVLFHETIVHIYGIVLNISSRSKSGHTIHKQSEIRWYSKPVDCFYSFWYFWYKFVIVNITL